MEKKGKKKKYITLVIVSLVVLTSMSFVFVTNKPVRGAENWADNDYNYRFLITMDSSKTDSQLSNFPVMVKIWDNDTLFGKVRADCYDIVFYDFYDNSTQYPHEIEYATASGNIDYIGWVKIPTVYNSVDTKFWCYYGYASASAPSTPTAVWDANYLAVYHMNNSDTQANGCYDSTSNANHGTYNSNLPTNVASPIGEGQHFDGASDYISIPTATGLTKIGDDMGTITSYHYLDADTSHIIWVETPNAGGFIMLRDWSTDTTATTAYNGAVFQWNFNDGTNPPSLTWYQLGLSMRTDDVDIIIDDTVTGSDTSVTLVDYGAMSSIRIGSGSAGGDWFDGIITEFRISDIGRTNDWMETTYDSNANTLLTFGAEEASEVATSVQLVLANDLFTFQGEQGQTAYANSSGTNHETAEFNVSYNGSLDGIEYIRVNFTADLHANITNSNISVQFNMQNSSWDANFYTLSDGANSFWVNSTVWNAQSWCIGSDPFPIQTNTSVWMRSKIAIPSGIGNETYLNSNFITWDAGYYN